MAYLSRYTHRVAISNRRLIRSDEQGVTFRWKDYRAKGRTHHKTMTLTHDEFMRRFLLHVLPRGFHRIRHYGLLANAGRRDYIAKARTLLGITPEPITRSDETPTSERPTATFVCPDCGAPMAVIAIALPANWIRGPPTPRGQQ